MNRGKQKAPIILSQRKPFYLCIFVSVCIFYIFEFTLCISGSQTLTYQIHLVTKTCIGGLTSQVSEQVWAGLGNLHF